MAKKSTILKVNISCPKCKKKVIQAVSVLQGIDKIEVDAANGFLTVTGDVDPIDVIIRARKAIGFAEVVSVGPPPKPLESRKKPEEDRQPETLMAPFHFPSMCQVCQQIGVPDLQPSCSIM